MGEQAEVSDGAADDAPLLLSQGAQASTVLPEKLFHKVALRIIPLLWLGYILNIIDRTNLAYAQLQMSTDLKLTPRAFGLASGIFFISYATMQVPANHLLPRAGALTVLPLSVVCWGATAMATAFVASQHQLLGLRFVLGLAESAYFPGVLLYLTHWFPDSSAGRAVAYFATAASVGGLLSSAASGLIMSALDGVHGVRGWRWLLFLEGLPAMLLGLVMPILLVESPHDARWLSSDEKRSILATISAATSGGSHAKEAGASAGGTAAALGPGAPGSPMPLGAALRATILHTRCRTFAVQYVVSASIVNSARFFLPTLLKEVFPTMAPWRLGLVLAAPAALKVLLSPPLGAWADRGGAPRRFRAAWGLYGAAAALLVCAGLGMATVGDGTSAATGSLLVLLVAAADVLAQIAIPVFWSLHNASQNPSLRGYSIAIVNSIGNLGGFLGPFVLGVLHDATSAEWACHHSSTSRVHVHSAACPARWGFGALLLGAGALLATTATAVLLARRRDWDCGEMGFARSGKGAGTDAEPI
jgi:MFS family permease